MTFEYLKDFAGCTKFPDDPSKQIDYVISYIDDPHEDDYILNKEARANFFTEVQNQKVELYSIKEIVDTDKKRVFKLLHCPLERLLIEAESFKLEMSLKKSAIKDIHNDSIESYDLSLTKSIRDQFYNPLFKDSLDSVITARYDHSLKFLFACDGDPDPFSPATRCLLLDNILNNINFSVTKIKDNLNYQDKEIGLPTMLYKKYIDKAYILHNQSEEPKLLSHIMETTNVFHNEQERSFYELALKKTVEAKDERGDLKREWSGTCIKYQPMNKIRSYFGESIAFYFAWIGMLITTLWLPSLIGIIFFAIGLDQSVRYFNSSVANLNTTSLKIEKLEETFTRSFDNDFAPYFAVIICLWGAFFLELFKRRNISLAFEWNVNNFERNEPDLAHYKKRRHEVNKIIKDKGIIYQYILTHEFRIKQTISFLILCCMASLSIILLILTILYRTYIKSIAYKDNDITASILGDFGSTLITTVLVTALNWVYQFIATWTTYWENHRTTTSFNDNLILKNFIFQFVNSYSSLFYLAFFRLIENENGLFNLGPEWQDKCKNDNCMSLLSLQVLIMLLVKPLPSFFTTIILPIMTSIYKNCIRKNNQKIDPVNDPASTITENSSNENNARNERTRLYEKCVKAYIIAEGNKADSSNTIAEEYAGKTILFGYLVMFASAFTLAPLIFLIINLIDVRVDARRLLWLYKKPVAYRAQDIGMWIIICQFLNAFGIITNGLIIAFTSTWSDSTLNDTASRLIFFVIFEHLLLFVWIVIKITISDVPTKVRRKIRIEKQFVDKLICDAKWNNLTGQTMENVTLPQATHLDQRINNLSETENIYNNQILSNASINSKIKLITDEPLPPLQTIESRFSIENLEIEPRTRKSLSVNKKLYSSRHHKE